MAEIWGRKFRPVRFQTKEVGPPRTCSQPAKARAEMRWCGEAWRREAWKGEGRGIRGREGVLRAWRRHLSLEGLQKLIGEKSRYQPG